MSHPSNKNRWVPFQCPLCFALFRLRKDQVGSAGNCPTCQSLIKVPKEEGREPVLRDEEKSDEKDSKDFLEKVLEASPLTEADRLKNEEIEQQRRRHYAAPRVEAEIDWEAQEDDEKEAEPSWFLIGSGAMLVVLILAIGIFYVKNLGKSQGKESASDRVFILSNTESATKLEEILDIDEEDSYKNEEGVDLVVEAVDHYNTFNIVEIESTIEKFLNSASVSERLKYVREPKRVEPFMRKFYGGEGIEAEGFSQIDKTNVAHRGDFVIAKVLTGEFINQSIMVQRVGPEDDLIYQVDWESWVGYCELTPSEMEARRPTEPFLMRVILAEANYYNYGFSDESEWTSYQLSLLDPEYAFVAYAKKRSEVEKILNLRVKGQSRNPYLVKVRYPEDARSANQLELVEIVSGGWLDESIGKESHDHE